VTEKEFQIIREFIEKKSLLLMKQDRKSFAKAGLDISKHFEIVVKNRKFFIISTNVFYHIMNSVLIEACEKYPSAFGINKTDTILEAIYNIENLEPKEKISEFLRTEQFAWLIELDGEIVNENILRVDLFRMDKKTEFTGGVFHAFKHFSYKGIPLSTHFEKNDIQSAKEIFPHLIKAFFFEPKTFTTVHKCFSYLQYTELYNLRFDLYFEPNTKVYFINSIRKELKQ